MEKFRIGLGAILGFLSFMVAFNNFLVAMAIWLIGFFIIPKNRDGKRLKKVFYRKILALSIVICLFGVWTRNNITFQDFIDNINETDEIKDDGSLSYLSDTLGDSSEGDDNTAIYIKLDSEPKFSKEELTTKVYEKYSELDKLGRTQTAIAVLGIETMPKENETRKSISHVKPSGWKQFEYKAGKYLYNRCHLIGWQLSAENANKENLITGTQYMNVEGMLPFENMVADYIKETKNHVAYRVTPEYMMDNLVASGVHIEAYSIEDKGEGINFNVYIYNRHPGIEIDYATGKAKIK